LSEQFPKTLVELLNKESHVAVLTGAGISAESGLPTFRGAGGWWRQYRAEDLATPQAFARDPKLVWQWYNHRREQIKNHSLNPGHVALAQLQNFVGKLSLITQCVDGYHRQAGQAEVIELHGNILVNRCSVCSKVEPDRDLNWRDGLPYCACGGIQRPGVVWFGENLPPAAVQQAVHAAETCSVFFSIGTSALVYPAAQLPQLSRAAGAYLVEINLEETPLTPLAQLFIPQAAGEVLPGLIHALQKVS
jgi:NAD-dependent deacetylase